MALGRVPGWRAEYEVEATGHWFPQAIESLDRASVGTMWVRAERLQRVNIFLSYSTELDDRKRVSTFFNGLGGCVRIIGNPVARVPKGTMSLLRISSRDKFFATLATFPGRVTLHGGSKKPHALKVLVELPAFFQLDAKNLKRIGEAMNRLPHFKLLSKPTVEQVDLDTDEFVDLNDVRAPDDLLDEKDVSIGMELFKVGYYDPKVKKKETLDNIAHRVNITKPTLIKRKKRLEALGITAVLSPRLSRQDMKKAAEALGSIVRQRKK
jgi:hypothetical protein